MTSDTDRAAPRRARLSPEDRRKQLIGIGLQMLTQRPFHQITVDDVAAAAGISRGLLFHYFATKQDYFAELARAGSRRLLKAARADAGTDPAERLRAVITGLVTFIERRRDPFIAMLRSASLDPDLHQIHEETRAELTRRVTEALGADGRTPGTGLTSDTGLVVRAWWSFAEELALRWTGQDAYDRDRLVALLIASLNAVVGLAEEG